MAESTIDSMCRRDGPLGTQIGFTYMQTSARKQEFTMWGKSKEHRKFSFFGERKKAESWSVLFPKCDLRISHSFYFALIERRFFWRGSSRFFSHQESCNHTNQFNSKFRHLSTSSLTESVRGEKLSGFHSNWDEIVTTKSWRHPCRICYLDYAYLLNLDIRYLIITAPPYCSM